MRTRRDGSDWRYGHVMALRNTGSGRDTVWDGGAKTMLEFEDAKCFISMSDSIKMKR